MSDPVDTDELREHATDLHMRGGDEQIAGEELIAAADEVDRLRAELDAWEPLWRHMRDERDRARAVVENAPHGNGCSWFNTAAGLSCDCWKADAL